MVVLVSRSLLLTFVMKSSQVMIFYLIMNQVCREGGAGGCQSSKVDSGVMSLQDARNSSHPLYENIQIYMSIWCEIFQ